MSKYKSNVNPDHYKTAGREPVGRGVVQSIDRQAYAQAIVKEKRDDPRDVVADLERPSAETGDEGGQRSGRVGERSPSPRMDSTRHKARTSAAKPRGKHRSSGKSDK